MSELSDSSEITAQRTNMISHSKKSPPVMLWKDGSVIHRLDLEVI